MTAVAADVPGLDLDLVVAVGISAGIELPIEPIAEHPGLVWMVLAGAGGVDGAEANVGVADDVRLKRNAKVRRDAPGDDRLRVAEQPPADERGRDGGGLPRRGRRDRWVVERLGGDVDDPEQDAARTDYARDARRPVVSEGRDRP